MTISILSEQDFIFIIVNIFTAAIPLGIFMAILFRATTSSKIE